MAKKITPVKQIVDERGVRQKRCFVSPPQVERRRRPEAVRFRHILPKPTSSCIPSPSGSSKPTAARVLAAINKPDVADHPINEIGVLNASLKKADDALDPVSVMRLKKILEMPSVTARDVAKEVMSMESLQCAMKRSFCNTLAKQCGDLCKKGDATSYLRAGSKCFGKLREFQWEDVFNELRTRAPDVLDVLGCVAVSKAYTKKDAAEQCLPPLCLAWAILMNVRNPELSAVQKFVTSILGVGGVNKVTLKRLNALRVCQSHKNWLRIMDDVGEHLTDIIQEEMRKGLKPRITFDNFDFRVNPGQLLKGIQNIDHHWICQFITFDRVKTGHLDNSKPKGDPNNMQSAEFLLTENEQKAIRSDYIVLVARVLLQYIPWLADLKQVLPEHIDHCYSKEMAGKSVIISLPVKPYNQNKHSDVVQYLDTVHEMIGKLSQNQAQDEHLMQMPLGGDMLGRERVTGAKRLRHGCDEAKERFTNITEVAEYWHEKQSLLSLCWQYLYKTSSAREQGTLYFFRNLYGRTNVKAQPKNSYAPCEGLLLDVCTAYILSAFMMYAGMESLSDKPTKIPMPATHTMSARYIEDVIGSFVDKYCLVEPFTDQALRKQQSEQASPHENVWADKSLNSA